MEKWKITPNQIKVLQEMQKVNDVVLIKEKSMEIITMDSLDESFNLLYHNDSFDFGPESGIFVFNISEILKSIKSMDGHPVIEISDLHLVVTDSNSKIKCKYLFSDLTLSENIDKIYELFPKYVEKIKSEDYFTFKFTEEIFNNISKFSNSFSDTLAISENRLTLFSCTGGTDLDSKDNIEFSIDFPNDVRSDIKLDLFRKVVKGNYNVLVSKLGFLLLEEIDGSKKYIITVNKE